MSPQRAVAWTVEAGLIRPVTRITRAERAQIRRADARFHRYLDTQYGADEKAWPWSSRYAYVSTVAAIHNQHQRRAA
jgi:hypothetical protein